MTEIYNVSLHNSVFADNPLDAVRRTFGQMNRLYWSVEYADGSHAVIRTLDVVVMPKLGPLGLEYRSLKEQIAELEALIEELQAENARLKSQKAGKILPGHTFMKQGAENG